MADQNWRDKFKDFEQIQSALDRDVPYGEPLLPEEIEYVKGLGIEFKAELGSGAYGAVWAVECHTGELQGWYACKVLMLSEYKSNSSNDLHTTVDKMMKECDIIDGLQHENIVSIIHVIHIHDEETGFPIIRALMFMDFCNGDLEKLMDQEMDRKLSDDKARQVMQQVCQGLKFLHDQNIVHFDIKPKNILFKQNTTTGDLVYKLTDFGLSQRFESGVFMVNKGRGTLGYIDPNLDEDEDEGAEGAEGADARMSDIYSLGCTLIAMLVGAQDMADMRNQITRYTDEESGLLGNWEQVAESLADEWEVTPSSLDLIRRMVQKDWRSRPDIDQVIADQWMTGADGF